ncbi:MAG: exosome complex exonuclease Rrp41 [Nitrososphaeraceae archaeon]|nr:exosome complex exonuclease Rrp41 [Nitrososphaeraceae archaeon]
MKQTILIDESGKRTDGRSIDDLREIKLTIGVLKKANGSAFIEFGKNKIIVAVYGPREVHPKHMAQPDKCVLRCRYHMSPFSTDTRKNPAPSRREIEISKVIREALEPAVVLEDYPRAAIDIFVEVLQADGGSRCAGITAASVALADAGINMRDLVAACAAGKINNKIALDINDVEDKEGSADMPVAYMPNLDKITLLQLDGILNKSQFTECLEKALQGCKMVYEIQRKALMEKYFGNDLSLDDENTEEIKEE